MCKKAVIVGAYGRVARHLIPLLSETHQVTGIVREAAHEADIKALSAKVLVLTVDAAVADYAAAFEGSTAVYYCAGYSPPASAPGVPDEGSEEKNNAEGYEGAVKVFDAIEAVKGAKPRLIMMSGTDIRDVTKVPPHYNEDDLKTSKWLHEAMPIWMKWKYEADKELVKRNGFKWTILRPGGFTDEAGTGKVTMGRTHLMPMIPREDVAKALAMLVDREDAAGLGIDVIGGDTPIKEALDGAIKKGETDFLG